MSELHPELVRRLSDQHVRIDAPQRDTLVLRGVPVHRGSFSKPATNLLIKRPDRRLPFVVCVDEDLQYTGPDPALREVFSGGVRRRGWKAILLGARPRRDIHAALDRALTVLGFGDAEPRLPVDREPDVGEGLLEAYGTDLSGPAPRGILECTVAREEEACAVAACLRRWGAAKLPIVLGHSGVGKSHLLRTVAGKLSELGAPTAFLRVDLVEPLAGTLFEAERESRLSSMLREAVARPETVVALEHIELVLGVPHGAMLLARALDDGARLAGTTGPQHRPAIQREPLERRVQVVELPGLSGAETLEALGGVREQLAEHHGLEIPEECLPVCVRIAARLDGRLPASAIALLDAAAARASLAGAVVVAADDLYHAAGEA